MADFDRTIVKSRYWWFVLYPESAPIDWIDHILVTGLPFAVSPLHCEDVNPDGTIKKPHFHVILCYNGPTTYSYVKKTITDPLNQPHPQYLSSVRGAYRYLTHKDNPEKHQYSDSDVVHYNGFDSNDFFSITSSDEDRLYTALEDFILEHRCAEFVFAVVALKSFGNLDLLRFFRTHTIYFKEFINSCRYSGMFGDSAGSSNG